LTLTIKDATSVERQRPTFMCKKWLLTNMQHCTVSLQQSDVLLAISIKTIKEKTKRHGTSLTT